MPAGRIVAGHPVVGLARPLELLGGESDAGRRALTGERGEQLLRQRVGALADALARVERAHQQHLALAGAHELLQRRVPPGGRAHALHRLRWTVELPRRTPDELAEAERVE